MQLNSNNKKIIYNGEDIVNVLKEIEYILISLHDMGSYYADGINAKRDEYEKETTAFIDNSLVCNRLAGIRKKLSEKMDLSVGEDDMDDLERACQDIDYWSRPGDSSDRSWVL
ncbi:MAG: hypothetical protein K6C13_03510 [Oscillospiraceae bacterium]|nr:hypothetical protein [Oscillospiraceae bacterium]